MRAPIIGIDPGLTAMGTAWAIDDRPDSIRLDTITDGGHTAGARLVHLRDRFRYILDGAGPELALIEGYSFMSKAGRERQGEIGGVLRAELADRGIGYVEVSPSSLKVWVAGNGQASKNRMMNAAGLAQSMAGGTTFPVDDHQADALGLYWLGVEAGAWWETPPMLLSPVDTSKNKNRTTRPDVLRETRDKLPERFLP